MFLFVRLAKADFLTAAQNARIRSRCAAARRNGVEHDPEKWIPVVGKDHAQKN
jgi:hypothetical protein